MAGLAPQHKLTLLEMLHRKLLRALELLQAHDLSLEAPEVRLRVQEERVCVMSTG